MPKRILLALPLLFGAVRHTDAQHPEPASAAARPMYARYTPAALCSAGSAALGLVIPAANAPAPGCSNAEGSPLGYLAFHPAAVAPESAYGTVLLPPEFESASATISFYADATSGSAGWILGVSCLNPNGAATGTPHFVTTAQSTAVSTTPDGLVTASFPGVIRKGANGCNAGSLVSYSITRSSTDRLSGVVYLLGISWTGVL